MKTVVYDKKLWDPISMKNKVKLLKILNKLEFAWSSFFQLYHCQNLSLKSKNTVYFWASCLFKNRNMLKLFYINKDYLFKIIEH